MKKTLSLFIIALIVGLVGCKPDAPIFPDGTPKSDSYQPVTKDSYWKYNEDVAGATITQTTTMTGATETINGKLYYIGNTVTGQLSANSYYYHGGGKYVLRSSTVGGGITLEYTYLVDNITVGEKWTALLTDNGSINGVPAQLVGEIMEVGISKVVSGKTFNNVVHTKMLFQYNFTGTMETVQTLDFYTARGVGLIQMDTSGQGVVTSSVLSSYSIK